MMIYQERFNLKQAKFYLIEHADAMVAEVYRVVLEGGQEFILKVCDKNNDYFREKYFLTLFQDQIPVPKIIQALPPLNHVHGAILMERLPGELLNPRELTKSLASTLGCVLAKVHAHRLSGYGDPLEKNSYQEPKTYFAFKFEEGLKECRHHLPKDVLISASKYFNTHLKLLESVDGPCVVHRDFRPGNIMVNQGRLSGLIDWAGARASFAEEDFCSLLHKPWLNDYFPHFLKGYETIRKLPDYALLIPFLRLNKAIATIGFTIKKGTWDKKDRRLYQYNIEFLKSLLSV